jgi:hypothetical protein
MTQEERVILTLADISEEFQAVENEQIVFAEELQYIGAKTANEAFFIGILGDDISEDAFTSEFQHETVKGSDVYGDILDQAYVTKGEIKGFPAFKVSDGLDEFIYVGPTFKRNLI